MLDRFHDEIREKVVIRGVVGVRLGSSFLYLFFIAFYYSASLYLAGNSFALVNSSSFTRLILPSFFITNLSIHTIFIIIIRMFITYCSNIVLYSRGEQFFNLNRYRLS